MAVPGQPLSFGVVPRLRSVLFHVRALHRLGPPANDGLSALRMAISVAVPSMVLLVCGRPDLIIYAVFGALTGMYGRSESHQLRLKHQLQAASVLLTGVGVGVLLSANNLHSWWLVTVEALLAGVGSIFSDKVNLKPNGPFFGILALGACASVPTTIPWYLAVLICAGSAGFSLVVGFSGWVGVRIWEPRASRRATLLRGSFRQKAMVRACRYVVAVGAAGSIGVLTGSGHPHWAMAAAAVPLAGADFSSSIHRGLHRIVGTCIGLVLTAVILFPGPLAAAGIWPGHEVAVLAMLVIVFQFTTELFMTRHYGLAMVSFTPVILLMTQLAAPIEPHVLITERGAETVLGAAVGMLVVLIRRRGRSFP